MNKQDAINSAKKRDLGKGEGCLSNIFFRHLTCCTQAKTISHSHVKDMIKTPIRKRTPTELDILKLSFFYFYSYINS